MKVFVLSGHVDHDGGGPLAVFPSMEEAEKYEKLYENNAICGQSTHDYYMIDEFEIIK